MTAEAVAVGGIVYAEQGMYAGWPANHGAWQWGDEFLVGFLRGVFQRQSMHDVVEPFELMQARSLDGGESWTAEPVAIPVDMVHVQAARYDITNSIIRVRGTYDHGGDYIDPDGCFWVSENRGHIWHGPYSFDGDLLENCFSSVWMNTSRTSRLGDLLFMSRADNRMWGTDEAFCARHVGGGMFVFQGSIARDKARAVMPVVAVVGTELVAAVRRRITNRRDCWIESYASGDNGRTWRPRGIVDSTGTHNGNPPALIERDGTLYCVYGNRSKRQINLSTSDDAGCTWSPPMVLRDKGDTDIGYPQLFKRTDGALVAVYYWADTERPQQHIAWSRIE